MNQWMLQLRDRLWSISTISRLAVDVQQPLKDRFIRFWPWPFGKMEKVTITEPIAQSAIAKSFHSAAIEEEKRLLYVSMTRARDLLVIAHGGKETSESWINTVSADWLKGEEGTQMLTLPQGGTIPYAHWSIELPKTVGKFSAETEVLQWFKGVGGVDREGTQFRLPFKFSPSSSEKQSRKVVETIMLGKRMSLKAGMDMAQLGTAIHGCIGANLTDPAAPMGIDEIEGLLQRMDVAAAVQPQELLEQMIAARRAGRRVFRMPKYPLKCSCPMARFCKAASTCC